MTNIQEEIKAVKQAQQFIGKEMVKKGLESTIDMINWNLFSASIAKLEINSTEYLYLITGGALASKCAEAVQEAKLLVPPDNPCFSALDMAMKALVSKVDASEEMDAKEAHESRGSSFRS